MENLPEYFTYLPVSDFKLDGQSIKSIFERIKRM